MTKKIEDLNTPLPLDKQLVFVSFCIEEYKTLHNMPGAKVAQHFEKYGVIDYLMGQYEILHSFGRDAILNDIEEFIQIRRKKK